MSDWLYLIGDVSAFRDEVFDQLSATTLTDIVVEAGNLIEADGGYALINPLLTTDQVGSLSEGRMLAAYVNVAVPDYNRYYWQTDWVTADPGDPTDLDYGTVAEDAPDWLRFALGTAEGPEFGPDTDDDGAPDPGDGVFGFIADYRDQAWQDIVITQAVAYVDHGYRALFLDDVGRYFETTLPTSEAAEAMMRFVIRLQDEVTAQTGISAEALHLTVNNGIYILNDYIFASGAPAAGARDFAMMNAYRQVVDGLVAENLTLVEDPDYWQVAQNWYTAHSPTGGITLDPASTELIAIETPQSWARMERILDRLDARGVDLFLAVDAAYSAVLNSAVTGTAGREQLTGSNQAEAIFGRYGRDTLTGQGGDDILYASRAGSVIYGGDGDDVIYGGPGDDLIFAGAGNDTVYGGGGDDTIYGGAGWDLLQGGGNDDLIFGGGGRDTLSGGWGHDSLQGGAWDDLLQGNLGQDLLMGGAGADTLRGAQGDDTLAGGAGLDDLNGGAGVNALFPDDLLL